MFLRFNDFAIAAPLTEARPFAVGGTEIGHDHPAEPQKIIKHRPRHESENARHAQAEC